MQSRQRSASNRGGAGLWAQSIATGLAIAIALLAPGSATKGSCVQSAWGATARLAAQSAGRRIQV